MRWSSGAFSVALDILREANSECNKVMRDILITSWAVAVKRHQLCILGGVVRSSHIVNSFQTSSLRWCSCAFSVALDMLSEANSECNQVL